MVFHLLLNTQGFMAGSKGTAELRLQRSATLSLFVLSIITDTRVGDAGRAALGAAMARGLPGLRVLDFEPLCL